MKLKYYALACAAIVLSLCGRANALQDAASATQKPVSPDTQKAFEFKKQIVKNIALKYLLYTPEDYGKDPLKKWPLMLFLHGSGESGDDVQKVKTNGPPKLIAQGKQFPFIVVSPQCPDARVGWDPEALNGLLDDVISHYTVDDDRIYLTGLSMGGYGTWALASESPKRFAAIAPICGGGNPRRMARRLKTMPIWVFHGAKDGTVPVKEDQEMVDALKAVGSDVKFTIYPDADHDSWTVTYNNPELYTWLLDHKRGNRE
jgi:predicted peptidase